MLITKQYQVQSMNAVATFDEMRDAIIYAHGVFFTPGLMNKHDFIWIIVTPENRNDIENGNNEFYCIDENKEDKEYYYYVTPGGNRSESPEDWRYYFNYLYGPLGEADDQAIVRKTVQYRPEKKGTTV